MSEKGPGPPEPILEFPPLVTSPYQKLSDALGGPQAMGVINLSTSQHLRRESPEELSRGPEKALVQVPALQRAK